MGLSYTSPWMTLGREPELEQLGHEHDRDCRAAADRRSYRDRLIADAKLGAFGLLFAARLMLAALLDVGKAFWLVAWAVATFVSVAGYGWGKIAALKRGRLLIADDCGMASAVATWALLLIGGYYLIRAIGAIL
jgi:hypothetical protein